MNYSSLNLNAILFIPLNLRVKYELKDFETGLFAWLHFKH